MQGADVEILWERWRSRREVFLWFGVQRGLESLNLQLVFRFYFFCCNMRPVDCRQPMRAGDPLLKPCRARSSRPQHGPAWPRKHHFYQSFTSSPIEHRCKSRVIKINESQPCGCGFSCYDTLVSLVMDIGGNPLRWQAVPLPAASRRAEFRPMAGRPDRDPNDVVAVLASLGTPPQMFPLSLCDSMRIPFATSQSGAERIPSDRPLLRPSCPPGAV